MKCEVCDLYVQKHERYTTFYYCLECDKTYGYNDIIKDEAQRQPSVEKGFLDKHCKETKSS